MGPVLEDRTAFGQRVKTGRLVPLDEDTLAELYISTHDKLTAAGFEHYEVSNFATPGHRARHNSTYWNKQPYVGIGPGAHEFNGLERRWNVDAYVEWVRRLAESVDPIAGSEVLDEENAAAESVYLGLRTSNGLRLAGAELVRAQRWIDAGWGTLRDDGRLVGAGDSRCAASNQLRGAQLRKHDELERSDADWTMKPLI